MLAAAVAIDAAPQGIPIAQLAMLAHTDVGLDRANLEAERLSRGEVDGYDLPNFDEEKVRAPVESAALSRNPGRLFAPKKHPMDADEPTPTPPPAPDRFLAQSLAR